MDRITADVTYGNVVPYDKQDDWQHEATPWTVVLHFEGRSMTVPYWTGIAITDEPTAHDVLECLTSDASSADEPFESWCADYGYDVDSRRAERIYKQVQTQTRKLKRLLGDHYGAYVFTDPDQWVDVAREAVEL